MTPRSLFEVRIELVHVHEQRCAPVVQPDVGMTQAMVALVEGLLRFAGRIDSLVVKRSGLQVLCDRVLTRVREIENRRGERCIADAGELSAGQLIGNGIEIVDHTHGTGRMPDEDHVGGIGQVELTRDILIEQLIDDGIEHAMTAKLPAVWCTRREGIARERTVAGPIVRRAVLDVDVIPVPEVGIDRGIVAVDPTLRGRSPWMRSAADRATSLVWLRASSRAASLHAPVMTARDTSAKTPRAFEMKVRFVIG